MDRNFDGEVGEGGSCGVSMLHACSARYLSTSYRHLLSTACMCSPDMKVSAREFQKLLDFLAEDSLRDLEASCIVCYDIL